MLLNEDYIQIYDLIQCNEYKEAAEKLSRQCPANVARFVLKFVNDNVSSSLVSREMSDVLEVMSRKYKKIKIVIEIMEKMSMKNETVSEAFLVMCNSSKGLPTLEKATCLNPRNGGAPMFFEQEWAEQECQSMNDAIGNYYGVYRVLVTVKERVK